MPGLIESSEPYQLRNEQGCRSFPRAADKGEAKNGELVFGFHLKPSIDSSGLGSTHWEMILIEKSRTRHIATIPFLVA
jgi:hypothetical protein